MSEYSVEERVSDSEKRITKLEDIEAANSRKLTEMSLSLRNIEKALIGSVEEGSTGIISVIKDYKKEIDENKAKISNLEKQLTEFLEEYKKYKWYLRGCLFVVGIIITYGLKAWELFK